MTTSATRAQVLGFRVRAQQLDRRSGSIDDTAVLDIGVQDTGPDGAAWALANRGLEPSANGSANLATVWTIRGAPHVYRRGDLASVAAAVAPYSEADAAKRIFDAAKPLKAAGIPCLFALDTVAGEMQALVTAPATKGDVSSALTHRLTEPYLRFCRPCNVTHIYEMPFRLAALRAGLELQPGTSPPVLQPIPRFRPRKAAATQHDVVRAYLRLLGPATHKHVADYLDAPVKDVRGHWPQDATEVSVDEESRWLLESDLDGLQPPPAGVRLLGPFDLFLQARDRALLVPDPAKATALWPVLGRPGAVLVDGEVSGLWRPRKAGRKLTLALTLWVRETAAVRRSVEEQAERLAAFRGATLAGLATVDG